jgi:hypothetical protein
MVSAYVLSKSDLRQETQRSLRASGYQALRVGPLNGRALLVEHASEDRDRLDALMRRLDPRAHRFTPGQPADPTISPPAPKEPASPARRSVWW